MLVSGALARFLSFSLFLLFFVVLLPCILVNKVVYISVNWTFFARCYGWGATSDHWLKIGDFAPMGVGWPKFHLEGVAPTNHSSSQKTRLNVLSCGIKIWTDLSSVLSQYTHVTDRRTDRILITIPRLHYMQRGKNWMLNRRNADRLYWQLCHTA